LAGAGIGAATGGIVGALIGLGIPEENARIYEDRIKAGDYLLMVSGNDDDIMSRTESIMGNHHVDDFKVFTTPAQKTPAEKINHRSTEPISTAGKNVPTTQGTRGEHVNHPPALNRKDHSNSNSNRNMNTTSNADRLNHGTSSEVVVDKSTSPEVIVEDKRTPSNRS